MSIGGLTLVILVALAASLASWLWLYDWVGGALGRKGVERAGDGHFFTMCSSGLLGKFRWLNRRLPSDPRCRLCLVPFGGLGKLFRVTASRKNPNFCTGCFEMAPVGGHETTIGVLFADIRGYTSWCESRSPAAAAEGLKRFYRSASRVLAADDAIIELVGDQVMGVYLPDLPSLGERTAEVMMASAGRLLRELRETQGTDVLPVGVGIHMGLAYIGNVRKGEVKDFTAVGDVVNTAARLQSFAQAGQIIMSESVFAHVARLFPGAEQTALQVKGKAEPVPAYVLPSGS